MRVFPKYNGSIRDFVQGLVDQRIIWESWREYETMLRRVNYSPGHVMAFTQKQGIELRRIMDSLTAIEYSLFLSYIHNR